jgi:hypothetical protein
MLLFELFSDNSLTNGLKQAALDYLTPLVAHSVPYITIQSMIDELRKLNSGLTIDRAFVLNLLDPSNIDIISKIEGDRIYISKPPEQNTQEEQDGEDNIQKVKNNAIKQAKNDIKKS